MKLGDIFGDAVGTEAEASGIASCANGVRWAVTYFALQQLGYDDVAVFTGSFGEWSSHSNRPVTVGEAP
jgi:3-mercaptopyruvate sulfurtransferase SseA